MKQTAAVIGLFLVITLLMTYPLVLRLGSSVRDMGDPLLNAWILSWNIEQAIHLHAAGFFDANIFYPQKKTLAYSEFLIPQSLAALPVKVLSGNPVLAYNVVVLLAFLTTGLGMFFLARHLTRNTLASVAAGLIFAFSPFMMAHLFQVQVLTAGGIPLAFLFLHKFFASDRLKDMMLFGLFFSLQALANGYYALYLAVFAGLFILIFGLAKHKFRNPHFWMKTALCGLLIMVLVGPFFYQYLQIQKDMGFKREIGGSASLTSYLATSRINTLYGKITHRFWRSEGELFPGIVSFVLACFGAAFALRTKRNPRAGPASPGGGTKGRRFALWFLALAGCAYAAILVLVAARGGFDVRLGPLGALHAHNPGKTALILLVLLATFTALKAVWRSRNLLPLSLDWDSAWIYALILVLAFLFTFGPRGPYLLLYKYVPGFSGIRVAARFQIFVMFSLSVLAAYGLSGLSRRLAGLKAKNVMLAALPVVILIEYLSLPLPLVPVPVKGEIPEVYQWLNRQPGDFAVVELPLPSGDQRFKIETSRVYFSTYHWKRLVNGYSGFFPPVYEELLRRSVAWPVHRLVRDFKSLGVRMMIVHTSEMRKRQAKRVLANLARRADEVREAARFGPDFVFEILHGPGEHLSYTARSRPGLASRASWSAKASVNSANASKAFDGSLQTRWDTAGWQKKGQWFELDMGRTAFIQGLSLKLGLSPTDYPRGIRVEVSNDSQDWAAVAHNDEVVVPIQTFIHPKDIAVEIPFAPVEARYIRLVQTGEHPIYYWSIYEMIVWSRS